MTDTAPPRWIDYVPIDEIVGADRNPKAHADEAIDSSVSRFGYVDAMILDERTGRLVAGHGRRDSLRRAHARGDTPPDGIRLLPDGRWAAPVQRGWASRSDQEADAFVIASNRLVEAGGWNENLLVEMLTELRDVPEGLDGIGYTPTDIDDLLASLNPSAPAKFTPLNDPDDAPDTPAEPVTKPGDIWRLGRHLLVCGDSRDPAVLDAIVDRQVDLVFTDPPYGVDVVGGDHSMPPEKRRAIGHLDIENDRLTSDELAVFLRRSFELALARTKPGGVWFVAGPTGDKTVPFVTVLERLGVLRQCLVWEKDSLVLSRQDYHYRHEALFFGWRPGAGHHRPESRALDSIWLFDRPRRSSEHPTMKPVALIERAIHNHTVDGDVVLDMFAGSGSTLIAAERTGRVARCVELDPRYVDVIVRRWQEHTGGTAERIGQVDQEPLDS